MIRFLLFIFSIFLTTVELHAEEFSWVGNYLFNESGANVTETKSFVISHRLKITEDNGRIVAIYSVEENGDLLDSSERWIGNEKENSITFIYDHCLPEGCEDDHKLGDPMLKLVYIIDKQGQLKFRSYWRAFKPADPKWFKSGGFHFEKQSYWPRNSTRTKNNVKE
jgi:hypothetical protein